MEFDAEQIKRNNNPFETASFLSKITFWWLKDTFRLGLASTITDEHVYTTLKSLESVHLSKLFSKVWKNTLTRKVRPSLLRAIVSIYGLKVFLLGFGYALVNSLSRVYQPLCLGSLVSYFVAGQNHVTQQEAYYSAGGIILCALIPVIVFQPFTLIIVQIGMRIRVACCSLMYKKILRIKKSILTDGLAGQTINIMSNDALKFDTALCFLHYLYQGPAEVLILSFFIYKEIGVSGLFGIGFMLCFIPLQVWMGIMTGVYRTRTAEKTDTRVRLMNEIIHGIQVIKMYAWEIPFGRIIKKIRGEELDQIKGSLLIRGTLVVFTIVSRFAIFFSLISYVYFGNAFTSRKVFIITSYFNMLYTSMLHFWPVALFSTSEVLVSIRRIETFLLHPETKFDSFRNRKLNILLPAVGESEGGGGDCDKCTRDEKNADEKMLVLKMSINDFPNRMENIEADVKEVVLRNTTACYVQKSGDKRVGIKNVNLTVGRGQICAVIGGVGCGKSTLLHVILGELEVDEGSVRVNGVMSYASQEPWLFEGSIRGNILFTEKFIEKRYREVVRVCALENDLEQLPDGDATIVGERGMSLSGGQKARVNLARAIYRQADIYLLDDPLSAVDSEVGKHIFENCVCDFLGDKVCVLVTHQLQYLKDVDNIVLMESGHIDAQGPFEKIKLENRCFFRSTSLMVNNNDGGASEGDLDGDTIIDGEFPVENSSNNNSNTKKSKEVQMVGTIGFTVYKAYFKAVGSKITLIWVTSIFVLTQFAFSGVDILVKIWVNQEDKFSVSTSQNLTSNIGESITDFRQSHIINYSAFMGVLLILTLIRSFSFFKMCLRISRNLHELLFTCVTRATMFFFNHTPSGRILNRFSQDIGLIDTKLTIALVECITYFLESAAVVILVGSVNYWLLLPTLLMSIILYLLRYVYVRTARDIKRVEGLTRSPIYSHANATFQGLSTIRALKAEKILTGEFHDHQNLNISASFMYLSSTRAFCLWLEMVCVLYVATVTLSFLLFKSEDTLSGNVGLAITQVFNLVNICQWAMRQTAELETMMTSVERVVEYTELKEEEADIEEADKNAMISETWPEMGEIKFKNVFLKYSDDEDFILKDLTFDIHSNEKIGIVGRTGAGKSSILQAIFRLAKIEGVIEIDGVDTTSIGLRELRQQIAIIPQEPILFTGTLRLNLDPLNAITDAKIWTALDQIELRSYCSNLPQGLYSRVSDGGANFSLGQRQLICLARAILRKNKILILDEATSNVDPKTDFLIQKTIRNQFKNCTVITIAHRLHTVMDSDRVLVMDAGRAVEFGTPYELLSKTEGRFKSLVAKTGSASARKLFQIAEQVHFTQQKL